VGDRGTKPSSSMISSPRRDSFRCRLSRGLSSLAPQRSALPRFHRRDAPSAVPHSQGGWLGLLRGYDHLKRGWWNVAQSVLVDVDALDDFAVLGAVHDLVLRVLGLVQRQSQSFHRFHLLVVRGTYPPKRVVYIEHNTSEVVRRRTKEGLAAARPGNAAAPSPVPGAAGHPHEGCRSDGALSLSPLTGLLPLSAVVTQTPIYVTVTQLSFPHWASPSHKGIIPA
jgi:hypothetical protein